MIDKLLQIIMYGSVILVALLAIFLPPYFEMKTFNKHSETKATYIEAIVGELRVVNN